MMKHILVLSIIALFSISMAGQSSSSAQKNGTPSTAPSLSPSKSIGMFAFPKNGQNADMQLKDENDCYGLAKSGSGIDPQAPPPAAMSAEEKAAAQKAAAENASSPKGGRVKGAAAGAAGGAAIGAIAGDAGKGAGIGAVAGTMGGGMRQRKAKAATKQQAADKTAADQKAAEAQAKLEHDEGLDMFQRAFSACMDARGYSVK